MLCREIRLVTAVHSVLPRCTSPTRLGEPGGAGAGAGGVGTRGERGGVRASARARVGPP